MTLEVYITTLKVHLCDWLTNLKDAQALDGYDGSLPEIQILEDLLADVDDLKHKTP